MSQILHISRDNKFLDFAINCFEQVCSGESYYWILENEHSKEPVTHIKYEQIHPIQVKQACRLIKDQKFISQFKTVIFHGISPVEQQVLQSIQSQIKVIWFGYGFDYYPLIDFFMQKYLDKKTKKYWYKEKAGLAKLGLRLNEYLPFWTYFKSKSQLKFFERVDYFAPVLEQEYDKIKSKHPNFKAKYIDWNYELGKNIFDSIGEEYVHGTNFLVGNSASITNNHIDCFAMLSKQKVESNRVLVPLSYGFPKKFKKTILAEGLQGFGDRFLPIEEFIPFADYLDLLKSCGYALFGSIRQQALGNIYMCLALGIKVYLHPRNPVLDDLKKKGFHVFDFHQFKQEKAFREPMPLSLQQENRELMRQMSLEENYLSKTKKLVELIQTFE
ncbi:TDP-N-acetylfucosamine:lipid II N-acetylfucosaminyltransferase [Algoriphagus vanfongensis]|uniref:TDP-N-acetylfucosamine:lipid II N-acetylfucosaminyltransferase n=1 Tax=Algoriphagus vanfongensis TaxID=426371 RepID=UPI0003F82CC4|nr:TDP-N-acetylfucosamine:lipid II N-acetylfucosaminyltransferase [Algoriphagus vanfongensis]